MDFEKYSDTPNLKSLSHEQFVSINVGTCVVWLEDVAVFDRFESVGKQKIVNKRTLIDSSHSTFDDSLNSFKPI